MKGPDGCCLRGLAVVGGTLGVVLALLVCNSLLFAARTQPRLRTTTRPAKRFDHGLRTVKVMVWNIDRAGIPAGGLGWGDPRPVQSRLVQMAEVIRREAPDFVILCEIMMAAGPRHWSQVAFLANEAEMHAWAFGEHYNVGVPGFRSIAGNAVLSRYPIEAVGNPDLTSGRAMWGLRGRRRVLWCRTRLSGYDLLLGAIHLDASAAAMRLADVEQILRFAGEHPVVLGGDFGGADVRPIVEERRTRGLPLGATVSPGGPQQARERPDLFVPSAWEVVSLEVPDEVVGVPPPVVVVFRVP